MYSKKLTLENSMQSLECLFPTDKEKQRSFYILYHSLFGFKHSQVVKTLALGNRVDDH